MNRGTETGDEQTPKSNGGGGGLAKYIAEYGGPVKTLADVKEVRNPQLSAGAAGTDLYATPDMPQNKSSTENKNNIVESDREEQV